MRKHTISFKYGFSRLLSLIFDSVGVNLTGVDRVAVRPSEEMKFSTLHRMGISIVHITPPWEER